MRPGPPPPDYRRLLLSIALERPRRRRRYGGPHEAPWLADDALAILQAARPPGSALAI